MDNKTVLRFPEREKQVMLFDFCDNSRKEISNKTGMKVNTVRSHQQNYRNKVKVKTASTVQVLSETHYVVTKIITLIPKHDYQSAQLSLF